MKILYTRIRCLLLNTYDQAPEGNALKRIHSLSGLITGMIRKGNSSLPAIGSGLPQDIDANSKTIAATRFVGNKWTEEEVHFLPFLKAFLQGMILTCLAAIGNIVIVIDGSQMGKDNAALMVSLVWRKRGIPLCWLVKSGSKGHFKVSDHVAILSQALEILLPLVPKGISITVLGDGEFDSIDLQKLCLENGCNYVCRTACNTVFYEDGERFQSKILSPENDHNCVFIKGLEFTKERFQYVNLVCWHDLKRHDDPIFLISNLSEPGNIIEYYDQRYSIECLFKDIKSSSFNIHKTRLKEPGKVSNLLMIAALAFILLTTLAFKYDQNKYKKKVHRVRKDQKVCSFFSFAYLLLDYFLNNQISFKFSFQFSKNE